MGKAALEGIAGLVLLGPVGGMLGAAHGAHKMGVCPACGFKYSSAPKTGEKSESISEDKALMQELLKEYSIKKELVTKKILNAEKMDLGPLEPIRGLFGQALEFTFEIKCLQEEYSFKEQFLTPFKREKDLAKTQFYLDLSPQQRYLSANNYLTSALKEIHELEKRNEVEIPTDHLIDRPEFEPPFEIIKCPLCESFIEVGVNRDKNCEITCPDCRKNITLPEPGSGIPRDEMISTWVECPQCAQKFLLTQEKGKKAECPVCGKKWEINCESDHQPTQVS